MATWADRCSRASLKKITDYSVILVKIGTMIFNHSPIEHATILLDPKLSTPAVTDVRDLSFVD